MFDTNESLLICPVCKNRLSRNDNTYKCPTGHSYDISKNGYVNLMMSQKSSKKRHGDDKTMLAARRDFLDRGYYEPLAKAIAEKAVKYKLTSSPIIIDAGCGEGYYTAMVHTAIPNAEIFGIDISKDALIYTSRRDKYLTLAAASAADIPIADSCADIIMSIFAPTFPKEFSRLVKLDGILLRVVPLEDHLYGLKCAVYDKAYKNPPDNGDIDGFEVIERSELRYDIELETAKEIRDLFMMTPYYYKTSREDQERLFSGERLITEVHFGIFVYKKYAKL